MQVTETRSPRGSAGRILLALASGAAVALSLGIYGTVHDPTGRSLVSLFFTETIHLKVWFATAAIALATFQVFTALRMYGKLGRGRGPNWISRAHRVSGVAAFGSRSRSRITACGRSGSRRTAARASGRTASPGASSSEPSPRRS